MKERSFLPLVLLLMAFALMEHAFCEDALQKKAIAGIYYEEIPSESTFYQSVAPIVYQFHIPKWSKSDMIIPMGSNCTSAEWSEGSTCPVRFYLPEVQSRFSGYLFNAQPLVNNFELMNASPQVSEIQFECDILSKHFQDIYIANPVLEKYLAKLKSCSPAGDTEFLRKLSSYNYNISEVYLNMRAGFFAEVWMKVHDGRVDAGLWSNALNVLNSLTFTNFYVEANRWKMGMSDCQNGRIPSTLLTPDLLSDTLQDLFENLGKSGLKPVISPEDVGNYFQAKIADCTFTNESFVLRILVPVTQSHTSYSLVRMTSAQFWDDDSHICEIGFPSSYVLMDNMNRVAYDTDCRPNELCHVPSVKAQRKINACASAFLNGHFWNLVKYCKLSCEQLSPYHLIPSSNDTGNSIFVRRVNDEKFLITGFERSSKKGGKPEALPTISCTKSADLKIKPVSFGAVEVTLPCGCYLSYDSVTFEYTTKRRPCYENPKSRLIIKQVVPFHWMGDEKLRELQPKKGSEVPVELSYADEDIQLRGNFYGEAQQQINSSNSSSGGTTFLLVLYFLLIFIILFMLLFLMHRLNSMGITVNPWKVIRSSQQISYKNVQRDNGLLSNEQ